MRVNKFPFQVEIYECGGCRIDGVWYKPSTVRYHAKKYIKLAQELGKFFVFTKMADTSHETALRVSRYFMTREG